MARTGSSTAWPERFGVTNVWTMFGHSYFQFASGTWDQTGRADAIFKSAMGIESQNWANYAQSGATLTYNSMWNNGWLSLFYETRNRRNTAGWPLPPNGGGMAAGWGINDIGQLGNTTQARTAYVHNARACASRWRAASVKPNTDASITYGAGMVSTTGQEEQSSTGTLRIATTTTAATVTITLPSTYKGEPVALCFIGRSGAVGGTVTFTGTALAGKPENNSTISTSNIMPSASGMYTPVVKRFTSLTSANANQTIIATVGPLDASGNVIFNDYWFEALNPPPVIWCNIARGTATMYANYYTSTWTGTEATKDADVQAWNAAVQSMFDTEFDSMVEVADIDRALNKDPDLMASGSDNQLHPNEHGAAKIAEAMVAAVRKLKPRPDRVAKYGTVVSLNPSASPGSSQRIPMGQVNSWYGPPCKQVSATNATWTAQTQWWIPFPVTEPDVRFDLLAIELLGTAPTTGALVRIGYYLDAGRWLGYPGRMITEWTGTGLAMGTTATWKTQAITWEPDPGLYHVSIKITATTTTNPTMRQVDGPNNQMPTYLGSGATPTAGTTQPMAWQATNQGTSSFGTRAPAALTAVATAPLIAFRRAAAA